MVCPQIPFVAPEIFPGVPGKVLLIVLQRAADTTPQVDVAVTHRLPTVKPGATLTVTELVPCPEVIDTLAGGVQLYVATPLAAGTLNTNPV